MSWRIIHVIFHGRLLVAKHMQDLLALLLSEREGVGHIILIGLLQSSKWIASISCGCSKWLVWFCLLQFSDRTQTCGFSTRNKCTSNVPDNFPYYIHLCHIFDICNYSLSCSNHWQKMLLPWAKLYSFLQALGEGSIVNICSRIVAKDSVNPMRNLMVFCVSR